MYYYNYVFQLLDSVIIVKMVEVTQTQFQVILVLMTRGFAEKILRWCCGLDVI